MQICTVLRLQPHWCFIVWKRILFNAFLPIKHTTTLENDDENGSFQTRFQKISKGFWRRIVLKTLLSSMDRWKTRLLKTATEKLLYTVPSISVFSVEDTGKQAKRVHVSNENELAWTGENRSKIFCFVLKTHWCDGGISVYLLSIFLSFRHTQEK